jgi:hypothetical protein
MQEGRSSSWQGQHTRSIKSLKEYDKKEKAQSQFRRERRYQDEQSLKKISRRINSGMVHNNKWKHHTKERDNKQKPQQQQEVQAADMYIAIRSFKRETTISHAR